MTTNNNEEKHITYVCEVNVRSTQTVRDKTSDRLPDRRRYTTSVSNTILELVKRMPGIPVRSHDMDRQKKNIEQKLLILLGWQTNQTFCPAVAMEEENDTTHTLSLIVLQWATRRTEIDT